MYLLERLLLASTKEGDLILDPFLGSGTTGVACKILNRKFLGIEQSKEFIDLAQKRIEATQVETNLF
ncbi:DNA modification methyltransferase [Streptococcus sp. HSISS2]|nr:DNA modification methyltransferase [Streptococcus sp. HSISS2]